MDGDKPRGGKWSYDSENRKKLPKIFKYQIFLKFKKLIIQKIKRYSYKKFSKHPVILKILDTYNSKRC